MANYNYSKKNNTKGLIGIFLAVLILFELLSATVLCSRIVSFVGEPQRRYIALDSKTDGTKFWTENKNEPQKKMMKKSSVMMLDYGAPVTSESSASEPYAMQVKKQHEFFTEDQDNTIWKTQTDINIFKYEYDETGEVTVVYDDESGRNDKLIAPGTQNSYTFTLKNTGKCTLDYDVSVEAYITGTDRFIPIEAKLKRYDGTYIVGGPDEWKDFLELDGASDSSYLSSDRIADYTIEWQWPFERGDDVYDTSLGDQAVTDDMFVTVVINTYAECNENHDTPGGEDDPSPGTGDNFFVWVAFFVISLILFIIVMIIDRKMKKAARYADEND